MVTADAALDRLRRALAPGWTQPKKRMFGGTCILLHGNMLCGTNGTRFMFRVGKERAREAAALPGADAMVQGGRRMAGCFWVAADAGDRNALRRWVGLANAHVELMPAKRAKQRKAA